MEELEESIPSRLRGAIRNFLRSRDSSYEHVVGNIDVNYKKKVFKLKILMFSAFVSIFYFVIAMNNYTYMDFVYYSLVWPWFILPVFHNDIPWILCFCCFWRCCSNVPTEDRGIQTIENTARQPVPPHDVNQELTVHQSTVEHDVNQELTVPHDVNHELTVHQSTVPHDVNQELTVHQSTVPLNEHEEQTALLLLRQYLSWRKMLQFFRRIYWLWSRCLPVDTKDREIQTEGQTPDQPDVLNNEIGAQAAFQPDTLQAATEENNVSAKMVTEEQRLLKILLGSTEESEYPPSQ